MAAINQYSEHHFSPPGLGDLTVRVHRLTLVSASDTITVPTLTDTTSGAAVKQLERSGDTTVTVTSSGTTVTIAGGNPGDEVVLVSLHETSNG